MSDWKMDIIIDKEKGVITKVSSRARDEYPQRMTNYERIKSMTIEEMAKFLEIEASCNLCAAYIGDMECSDYDSCLEAILEYLESEVEE